MAAPSHLRVISNKRNGQNGGQNGQNAWISTSHWRMFMQEQSLPFALVTTVDWCACMLILPKDTIAVDEIQLPAWWHDCLKLSPQDTVQITAVEPNRALDIVLQPFKSNVIPVVSTPSDVGCSIDQVVQIFKRQLLGYAVTNRSIVTLLMRENVCLFMVHTEGTVLIGANTSVSVRTLPFEQLSDEIPFFGYQKQMQELVGLLRDSFNGSDARKLIGLEPLRGILLSGRPGCGKSCLIENICRKHKWSLVQLSLTDVLAEVVDRVDPKSGRLQVLERSVVQISNLPVPTIWHVSDLHLLSSNIDDSYAPHRIDVANALVAAVLRLPQQVCLVAESTTPLESMLSSLKLILSRQIVLNLPASAEREELFAWNTRDFTLISPPHINDQQRLSMMVQQSSGLSGREIVRACVSAKLSAEAKRRTGPIDDAISQLNNLTLNPASAPQQATRTVVDFFGDLLVAIDAQHIFSLSHQLNNQKNTKASHNHDFKGFQTVRQRLEQVLLWPLTNSESFRRLGIAHPRGILLFGPPGCGKSLLASELLTNLPVNSIRVRGSDIFSKYLGESERAIRLLFANARQKAPCIIFFDELDAIAVKRDLSSDSGTGVSERMLSQLLNEMDGISETGQVIVFACTNRPDKLDDALLRQGRLDQLVYIGIPSAIDRKAILLALREQIPTHSSVDIDVLVSATNGFVGADLRALYRKRRSHARSKVFQQRRFLCASNYGTSTEVYSYLAEILLASLAS